MRGAALTRQLLAFSRQQVLAPQNLDLNSLVRRMERLFGRLIGEDVKLQLVLAPDLGTVRADPGQLEQVVMNLAVNARDAMPTGGRLTVETANVMLGESYSQEHLQLPAGPYVRLSITDTGVGMDGTTRARIFEPFFTTKEKGKGTGLGLATVYGIVKQSGGYIWVYSELGRGTTFKGYLPSLDTSQEAVPAEREQATALRGSETILLVEDDPAVRRATSKALAAFGYSVVQAEGPEDVMPEMEGPELARRVATVRPDLRVLFMSGYTDDTIVHHGVLDPGIAFLQKPFSPQSLARKVREVLATPR